MVVQPNKLHATAQRPGSYVMLKYVRDVIKVKESQAIHCPPAPVGVLEGSRADVSFIVGLLVDKFCYHNLLYRQHQRLQDSGIHVSRPCTRAPRGAGGIFGRPGCSDGHEPSRTRPACNSYGSP